MKIITWNLWDYNTNIRKSLKLVFSKDPDIVCLQEFRSKDIKHLRKYKQYKFLIADDFIILDKLFGNKHHLIITAIKKKYFVDSQIIKFPLKHRKKNLIKWWTKWEECREGLIVDIKYKNKKIRILNVHLSFAAGPSERLSEMKFALKNIKPDQENIICGDLNVFGIKYYNPLIGWLFGYRFKDYFLTERYYFEKLFEKLNLANIYVKFSTIPFIPFQPDHILIPKNYKVKKIKVLKKSYVFSDHYMLFSDVLV